MLQRLRFSVQTVSPDYTRGFCSLLPFVSGGFYPPTDSRALLLTGALVKTLVHPEDHPTPKVGLLSLKFITIKNIEIILEPTATKYRH
jgi:hypothetical protein